MTACILCGASQTDRAGTLKHEGSCPHFMRGPDPGGDPFEWPTIYDALKEEPFSATSSGSLSPRSDTRA